jgi:ParB/RepB/Spo0J family partition protein
MKVKLSRIKVNPSHTQVYSTNALDELVESMEKNGLLEPIIISPDKTIISGHRRYFAAQAMGWEEIEVIFRNTVTDSMEYTTYPPAHHTQKKSSDALNEIQRLYHNYTRSHQGNEDMTSNPDKQQNDSFMQFESWYW